MIISDMIIFSLNEGVDGNISGKKISPQAICNNYALTALYFFTRAIILKEVEARIRQGRGREGFMSRGI